MITIEGPQNEAGKERQPRPSRGSLSHVEFVKIIDMSRPLAALAGRIDRDAFEEAFGAYFCENNGAPDKPIRLMVGLHYPKHTFNLSDELTVRRWMDNPYRPYFLDTKSFGRDMPIHPASMTRRRKKGEEFQRRFSEGDIHGLSVKGDGV